MRRALIGFSEEDLASLDAMAQVQQVSRSELIRQAVASYLAQFKTKVAANETDEAFGLWKQRQDLGMDGLDYQNQMREEW